MQRAVSVLPVKGCPVTGPYAGGDDLEEFSNLGTESAIMINEN